jgi:sugar phosphate isomerase/epimerase
MLETAVTPQKSATHTTKHNFGVCIFGIEYLTGRTGRGTPRANPNPLSVTGFLDLAARLGLNGVECPVDYISPSHDPAELASFRAAADERGLRIVIDGPRIELEPFRRVLPAAASLGAKVVRCTISGVLCGDRRPVGGLSGWRNHLSQTAATLKQIALLAEDLGLRIGVENHQDATSADLLWLCEEVGSPAIGVTLDTGNPLAVAEDPVAFAERILPHLVHVHLKDYRMMRTPEGYRLFHCAIGDGVVDYASLFRLFATKPEVLTNIEMAALGERPIRMLADDYWACHAPRPVSELIPVLRMRDVAEPETLPESEWRTPWETGEDAKLAAWEMQRLEKSVANMSATTRKLQSELAPA